jgi:hypothetical protein
MYSEVFNLQFDKTLSARAQARFLADLFEAHVSIGGKETDIYWCMVSVDGFVEFYSNSPAATDWFSERLSQAELDGTLVLINPGWGSGLRFLNRMIGGLLQASVRAIFRR